MSTSLRMRRNSMCTIALFAVLAQQCTAYPAYWVDSSRGLSNGCQDQPARGYGPHGSPDTATTISFTATDSASKVAAKVCPGETYTVQIDTGSAGRAVLTASQGSLSMSSDACAGRAVFDPDYNSKVTSEASTWTTDLTVPCTATGDVVLAITYAAAERDNYHQNTNSFSVDSTCSATSCSSNTLATTTTTTNSTTATTSTTTAPTTTPTTIDPATTTTPTPTTTPATTATLGGEDHDDGDDDGRKGHDGDDSHEDRQGRGAGDDRQPATGSNGVTSTTDGASITSATATAQGTTKATPPTSSTPTTTTSAAAGTVTSFTAPMCKQPVQTSNTTCSKSALGYACSSTLNGMTLHYTVGGCPPSNPCTASYALRNPSASAAQPYLHMAASYPTTGYVSVGFARNPGSMPGTDAVIGWVMDDGTPRINSYYVDGTSVSSSNMYANAGQWMVLAGVAEEGGITTICFSRPVDASTSKVAPQLKSSGAVGMNWAYSKNGRKALVEHAAAGGFAFNPTLGGGLSAASGTNFMLIHGVLMGLAWIELVPLGVLLARHKTLMGDRKLCGIHVWFHLHRIVQLVAVGLFAGGLALAYLKLSEPQGGIGKAHGILAWVLIALIGLQLVVSFLRPKPTEALRKYWNLLHWNIGRLAAAVGIANTYIGVKVYKRQRLENVTVWYIVISVILGVYLVADVVLSVWGRKAARVAAQQQQQEHQAAVNKGAAVPLPADVEIALQHLS